MNAPPPIPPPSKRSPWIGVGVGCGVVFVILILAIVFLVVYMMRAGGRHVQVERLIPEDSIAVMHLTDCRDDAGVKGLLGLALKLQQDLYLESFESTDMPALMQGWSEYWFMLQSGQVDTEFIPEVVVSITPDSSGTNISFSAAVTLTGFPRIARYMVSFMIKQSAAGGAGTEYRKVSILDMGDFHLAIPRGALFVSGELSGVEKMVDRFKDGTESPTNLLAEIDSEWKANWDLYAMFQNRDGLLTDMITGLAEETFTNAVGGAEAEPDSEGYTTLSQSELIGAVLAGTIVKGEFGINVAAESEIHGELLLECASEDAAGQVHDLARERIDGLIAGLGEEPLRILVESNSLGNQVQIQIIVKEFDSWMKIKAKGLMAEMHNVSSPGAAYP